jgi:alkaline phosphatase D
VELRVADDADDLGTVTPIHTSWPSAETDFTDTVTIHGLTAGRTYAYNLTIEGVVYGPWDIRTPSPDSPVRLAFGSCTKEDDQAIFAEILDLSPDLFLFVGDNHYGNTAIPDAQRSFYRWAHERDGRAELLSSASILATWDDHDYAGDNTNGTAIGREDALSVFRSYWANPAYGTDDLPGTFYRWRYGDVEVFAVDDRYYKDLEDSTLGAAQTAWLVEALHDSTARFKVLASGTQVTSDYSSDAYYVHEADRDALLTAIADVEGLVILSGDIHRSEFRLDSGVGGPIPELTSSPMANASSNCRDDDELVTCYDSGNSVIVLDFSPDGTLEAQLVLEDGTVEETWAVPL